ncbi:MAG: AAA family ATPase [Verrucomicrobia bacterium]|nr:AAA family ATPase [Verrucomicrobiota bacterium]MDE3047712.1 ATP-binding protein [Verrucomicrobiota bacterium]
MGKLIRPLPLIRRFFHAPTQSFFLFGPRGTGKSTWLKARYPDALWIDLLELDQLRLYSAHPERLKELLAAHPHAQVIVIDEVQKVPDILSVVHALIEEKRGIQFILTGSSARKLRRAGVDLLAGRALLKHMPPFYAAELGEQFQLQEALELGLLPIVRGSEAPEETLKTYVGMYLKEEVQAEGLVRNIGDFARFLEAISFSHASELVISNVARECSVQRKTVENYLQILQDLLLGYTLSVFTKRAQRALAERPKFYLFDAGVYRSLRPHMPQEIAGAALEGLVCQHLRSWVDAQVKHYELGFWRTRSKVEVDFVVYGPDTFLGIEVKHTETPHPGDLSGLKAFKQDYPECTPLLLYRGKTRVLREGILCVPCEEFLLGVRPDLPLWK